MDFAAFDRSKLDEYSRRAKELYGSTPESQDLVKRIQDFITENMYTCSNKILRGLGKMYSSGGDFTRNIDAYGGEGTAEFVDKAIQIYCDSNNAGFDQKGI